MQVLVSLPEDKLKLFSKIAKHSFIALNEKNTKTNEKQCAVIMAGNGEWTEFVNDLNLVVSLHIPIIIIAGEKDKEGQQHAKKAQELGVPDDAIFFKQDDQVISLSGRSFKDKSSGIKVDTICELCAMAIENLLIPEILFWKKKNQVPIIREKTTELIKPVPKNEEMSKPKPEAGLTQKESDLISVLELGEKIITVYKTTKDANSHKIAKDIAIKLQALHLEVNITPQSLSLYGKTLEDALRGGHYAFSNGKTVSINNNYSGGKYIVLEIDPCELTTEPDAMNFAYEKAHKIIHVLKSLDSGKNDIDNWIGAKFKLDYIIPEEDDVYAELKSVYGDLVCNVDEAVRKIK